MGEVKIEYFPDFVVSKSDREAHLEAVREAIPHILTGLKWIREKPEDYRHILQIWLEGAPFPGYLELQWENDVEVTIEFHDLDFDLSDKMGLVQIEGLYTRTVERDVKEINKIKDAVLDVLGKGKVLEERRLR